ncbi:DUF4192 domain-containing protein [Micromonospora sp. NPDC048935]|uniref:DUF4192 domain-containing protein n=1 Tax=Micromonospora sp. NPDC048935 TaxID=3364262 RepID=UPI00371B80DB
MPRFDLRSAADLVDAVPLMLGFHPERSVVVVGVRRDKLECFVRGDLNASPDEILRCVARQGVDAALVAGYGPESDVTPAVETLIAALERAGLRIREAVRVTDGLYWSYLCTDPDCCRLDGGPVQLDISAAEVAAVVAGRVILPTRDALVATVQQHQSIPRAIQEEAWATLPPPATAAPQHWLRGLRVAVAWVNAIGSALTHYHRGDRLRDVDVARLAVLLTHKQGRFMAWRGNTGCQDEIAIWAEVARRLDPSLSAAPLVLLAVTAWRGGDGVLAGVALDRALREHPDDEVAQAVDGLLRLSFDPTHVPNRESDAVAVWRRHLVIEGIERVPAPPP